MSLLSKVRLAIAIFGCTMGVGLEGCEQPELMCTRITGNYVAHYELLANKGNCDVVATEVISGAYFLGEVENGQANPKNGGIGLVPWSIRKIYNSAVDRAGETLVDDSEFASSYGRFTGPSPNRQRCAVKKLSALRFHHGELPPFDFSSVPPDEVPADQILERVAADRYHVTWRNVEVQIDSTWLGSYFEGELMIQRKCGDVTDAVQAVFETVCRENADCHDVAPRKARCNKDFQLSWRSQGTTFGTCELTPQAISCWTKRHHLGDHGQRTS